MKTKPKFIFIIGLIALFGFSNLTAQTTSVYVTAHPDDWQLFMNPNAYNSIKGANEKVVFIHTTAGDAGDGVTNNHYLAREEGSLRAIRFMSNTFTNQGAPGTNMNQTTVNVNGHQILKFSYRNAVMYFLRLPDGNYTGTGYPTTNNQSLQKLYNGSITNISAVDGSTTYSSLADLENTLKSIVQSESTGTLKFNSADTNNSINPDDHSDHLHSSLIMQDVANLIGGVTLNLYSDYDIAIRPVNIFNNDLLVNAGTWGATASGLSDNSFFSTWDNDHNVWLYRQYYRTVPPNNNPVVSVLATDPSASENPLDTGTFTVSLNSINTGSPVVINYEMSGTATPGSDYTVLSGTVTIPNGQQSKTITVTPIDDSEAELTETVILTLTSDTSYNIGTPETATINMYSEDVIPPGTNLALLKPTTASNGFSTKDKAVDGIKNRSNYWQGIPYPQWWQVDLGSNFDISKLVVFTYYDGYRYYQYDIQASTDGNNWTTVVDFNSNTSPATNEGNTFNLNNPKARYLRVNMNYNSANQGVHIIEFEAYGQVSSPVDPQVTIEASDASASENPLDTGTFTVSLDAVNNNSGPLTVNYTIGGTASSGSDYNPLSGTVIIPVGQQTGFITVTPVNDLEIEPIETVALTLSSGSGYTIGSPSTATVNIVSDDDLPPSGNIALNKPTNSSSGTETASSNAVDGIYSIDNWWGASPFPQWWSVDLGDEYDLSKLVVFNYYDGIRYYQYDIQGSLNGTNWTTLVDFNTNTTPATSEGNTFNLGNPSARYIRVNMNYNSVNTGVHIIEFEAYGTLTQNLGKNFPNQTNSPEKRLDETSKKFSLSVYPNPSKYGNPIKLALQLPKDESVSVEIFDINGKMVTNKEFELQKGFNEVEMPTNYFSAGMLIVKVDIQGEIITKKIFLE